MSPTAERLAAEKLVAALAARGMRVATAESCTGGMLAAAITSVPGASEVFTHGFITYSDDAKRGVLRVRAATLEKHGAVSELCVREMAAGALRLSGADLAAAVSGVAGPSGGSADKPVGTVWIAVARRANEAGAPASFTATKFRFDGDRAEVRRRSAVVALVMLLEAVEAVR
jgi:nicotinamide-nucleotide amidase